MSPTDPTNTDSDLFADLLPEESPDAPRKPRRRKSQSSKPPAKSPATGTPAPSSVLAPDPFWDKVEALWAQRGIHLRPKVIMRTDPKTGKTVFTNTEIVPELAPRQVGAQWAASPSSSQCATESAKKSTAKMPNCDASSAFCGTSKTPSTPAVSGDDNDLHTKRPQNASSTEPSTANSSFCSTFPDFCDASKTPLKPVFTGLENSFSASRPHEAHSDDFVTATKATCDANPVFCGTPETPTTPVFSGHTADSSAVRPHEAVSQPTSCDRDAMEPQVGDPPDVHLKKLALKIFQNGGSYKTVAGNLGISRDKARTWKRLWQIGRFEDNIRGIRFSGEYSDEIKAKVRERLQAGATPGELEKEFRIPRQTIRKWCQNMCNANALQGEFQSLRERRLPFPPSLNTPNAETRAALDEADRMLKAPHSKTYSVDDLLTELKK